MLNFVSGHYGEMSPMHRAVLRLMQWGRKLRVQQQTQSTSAQAATYRGMDRDPQLMLTLARQQMTNLTK